MLTPNPVHDQPCALVFSVLELAALAAAAAASVCLARGFTHRRAAHPTPAHQRTRPMLRGRRMNAAGITPELPTARAWAWNVAFLAVEAAGVYWAHYNAGVAWWAIAAGFGAVLALGIAVMTYVIRVATPRAVRRHEARLRAALTARSDPLEAARRTASATTRPQRPVGNRDGRPAA